MVSISRSISLACGTMDSKQPMVHIRLYREGGRYVESFGKKVYIYIIADEQPSTLGYQISNKSWVTGVHRGNNKAFYSRNSSMATMASRRTRSASTIAASPSLSSPDTIYRLKALNSVSSVFS
jgi:hypothetical protein